MASAPDHYPEYLVDVFNTLRDRLKESDVQDADKIALALVEDIRALFEGDGIYLPKFTAEGKKKRNSEIIRLHDSGVRTKEISRRFGLTKSAVCRIISGRLVGDGASDGGISRQQIPERTDSREHP